MVYFKIVRWFLFSFPFMPLSTFCYNTLRLNSFLYLFLCLTHGFSFLLFRRQERTARSKNNVFIFQSVGFRKHFVVIENILFCYSWHLFILALISRVVYYVIAWHLWWQHATKYSTYKYFTGSDLGMLE